MNLRTRLFLAFAIIALPMIGTGALGITALINIRNAFRGIVTETTPALTSLTHMQLSAAAITTGAFDYALEQSETGRAQINIEIEQAKDTLNTWLLRYRRATEDAAERQLADAIEVTSAQIYGAAQILISLVDSSASADEIAAQSSRVRRLQMTLANYMGDANSIELGEFEQGDLYARQVIEDAVTLSIFSLVLSVVIAGAIVFFLSRTITRPVYQLRAFARHLAGGDYARRAAPGRDDEIGQLAAAFNAMADAIQQRDAQLTELNQSLERRVRERTADLEALHQSSLHVSSSLELQAVLEAILDQAFRLTKIDDAHIFFYDGERLTFGAAFWDGTPQQQPYAEPRPHGLTYAVARSGARLIVPDVSAHSMFEDTNWTGSLVGIPLLVNDRVVGVMSLGCTEPHEFTEVELERMAYFADETAIAIHNAQLYQQVQTYAHELERRVEERTLELQRAKEHVEAILDNSSDAIILINQDGEIVQTNPGFDVLLRYQPGAAIHKPVLALAADEQAAALRDALALVRNTGQRKRLEVAVRRSDGSVFPADVALSAITASQDRQAAYVICSLRDMTERQRMEEALKASEARLQAIIDNANSMIFMKDRDGHLVLVNRAYENAYRVEHHAVKMKTDHDLFPAEIADHYRANDQQVIERGVSMIFEETAPLDDGVHTYLVNKFPLFDASGQIYAVCGIATDITERKREEEDLRRALQRERELNELKSRFSTMVSHEFRTPLAVILSSADLIQNYGHKMSDDKKREAFARIHGQVQHMVGLLEDILTVSKSEKVRLEFHPVPIELDALCAQIAQDVQLAADPRYRIVYTRAGECETFWGDEKLLCRAIVNLLNNAVKYSPNGGDVRFDLTCTTGEAVIRVQDDGIGIPEQDRKHLFEDFYRASNVGAISGTGVGLPIVRQALELHGGTITCDSAVGVGTTFTMRLPNRTPTTL